MQKEWKVSSIKWSFENWKFGSYPINDALNDLTFEYEQRLFTKRPIGCLIDDIVEILKVSSIEQFFDDWIYVGNPWNYDLYDLRFNDDKRLITGWWIYSVCLSIGLSSRTAKIIHDRVVDFPVPRTSAWSVPRLCTLIELGVYVSPPMMMWSLTFPPSEIHPGS